MSCATVDRDLDAYVDRELDARCGEGGPRAPRRAARPAAGASPSVKRSAGWCESAPYYPAPDRLRAQVAASAGRAKTRRRLFAWARRGGRRPGRRRRAVTCCDRTDGKRRRGGRRSGRRPRAFADGRPPVRRASHRSAHRQAMVPGQARFLAAGRRSGVDRLSRWSAAGWIIWAAALSAALVYERRRHTINVFVSPGARARPTRRPTTSVRGFHVRHWVARGDVVLGGV